MRTLAKYILIAMVVVGLLSTAAGLLSGIYVYIRLTRDLPKIERVNDYRPKAVTSIYSADGTLIAERFEERRYPTKFNEIPQRVRQAFLAAEDADFYRHPGIDFRGILRAVMVNLRNKKVRQGASTITQQIVKSLLLSRERTYERKAKEAILAYRLEHALTKDEIFSIYLNEIYLGSGSYGVEAAAKVHFHKTLAELTLGEAAYLAGLPQKPTELSRPENRPQAIQRQRYVLRQMKKLGMISDAERIAAEQQELVIYPPEQQTIFAMPYFSGYVLKLLDELFRDKIDGYVTPTNPGGFKVYTTANLNAQRIAERALKRGLRELDKRQGWRGPVAFLNSEEEITEFLQAQSESIDEALISDRLYPALVTEVSRRQKEARVQVGSYSGIVELKRSAWAKKLRKVRRKNPLDEIVSWVRLENYLRAGHVIEVRIDDEQANKNEPRAPSDEYRFVLEQTPEVEAAFVASHALTGEVIAILGGYDYQRSQFNRATQGKLQPGSAFKPFVYLTALEQLGYTPATIVSDSPFSMIAGDGELWAPKNYDKKFLGPITLRTALERSRNVVSVYLLEKTGIDHVINTARRLGITTPISRNMSISLGTPEVKLIELVRAYGTFAAGGWLADRLVVTSIRDRDDKIIYEERPKQKQVIDENDAFIIANMMKGVVERGTARSVSKLGKPVAGKTGTTNDQMDAWFVGYTPEWVAGVWVGYDVKRTLGRFETGGKAAAPIFRYFMNEFLEETPALDFDIPDGVIPVTVDPETGHLIDAETPGGFVEYFKSGTEPRYTRKTIDIPRDYLSNDEF